MPTFSGNSSEPVSGRVAIVVSRFNEGVTSRLLHGAEQTLQAAGLDAAQYDVVWVPGAFEIPTVAQRLAVCGQYAAVICLGAVIRGETTHDQHINRAVSQYLMDIAVRTGVPVLFGVLTCETLEQALQRAGGSHGNKGAQCAAAALEMIRLLGQLPGRGTTDPPSRPQ